MEIVLVRHAEPAWLQDGVGVTNPGLTDRGHRQAELAAQRLAEFGFDELWVSPLQRAQETAAPLVTKTGLAPQTFDWLAEARPPAFDGMTREELRSFFENSRLRPVHKWWAGIEGGEALSDFVARVSGGIDGLLGARSGARRDADSEPPMWRDVERDTRVCVVSHAGTTAAALSHLLGLRQVPWAWERFYPMHASISRTKTVALSDGLIFSLRAFSLADHLAAEDRTR